MATPYPPYLTEALQTFNRAHKTTSPSEAGPHTVELWCKILDEARAAHGVRTSTTRREYRTVRELVDSEQVAA
jgi:hypothetical protein